MKVVVIGSGLSGLTAGALLAKEGHNVKIFEQHEKIGGVTATIEKDGYKWDWGQMLVPDLSKGEPGRGFLEELEISDDVKVIPSYREYYFPDFEINRPKEYKGVYWRKQFLSHLFPNETKGLNRYYKIYDRVHDLIGLSNQKGLLAKLRLIFTFLPLIKKKAWTAKQLMDHCFSNEKLKSVFTHILADYTSSPEEFPGLIIPIINAENQFDERVPLEYGNHEKRPSWVFVKNGYGELVNALVKAIKNNGGKIFTNTIVKKINIIGGKVSSILTSQGKEDNVDVVVASGGARELFLDLIGKEHLPKEFIKKYISQLNVTDSVFMVHLGVDYDPSVHQNGAPLRYYYLSHDLKNTLKKLREGFYHKGEEGFLLYIPSKHSPEMAPPGHHSVTIYTIAPNNPKNGTWKDNKELWAEKLLDIAEQFVPDLRAHEKTRIILTPEEFKKRTFLNHHAFGGTVPHMVIPPPPHKTPINGLWFVGAQSETFGGVTAAMTGAQNVVNMISKQNYARKTDQSFNKFSK